MIAWARGLTKRFGGLTAVNNVSFDVRDKEILSVLCLDTQNSPNSFNVVSVGSLNTTRTRYAVPTTS